MNAVGTENFFWGEEYYTGLVKFIPRFLWPDKPLSFDYKLKELANYDFEGGGIYIRDTVKSVSYMSRR